MEILRKVVAGLVALTGSLIFIHHSHAVAPVQKSETSVTGFLVGYVYVPANYSVPR